jgi:hypothetical protein
MFFFGLAWLRSEAAEPPAIPQDLQGKVEGNLVELSWSPVNGATGYVAEFRQDGEEWNEAAEIRQENLTFGLSEFTQYSFRVRAHNDFGYSDYTPVITFTTGKGPRPPSLVPQIRVKRVTFKKIDIEWDPIPEATGYQIGVRIGSDAVGAYTDLEGQGKTSFSMGHLAPETEVRFRVHAVNPFGQADFSEWFLVKTLAQPGNKAEAEFLGTLQDGGSSWPKHFGGEGYIIPFGSVVIPDYAELPHGPGSTYWWSDSTGDDREILVDPWETNRVAATFFDSNLQIALNIKGDQPKKISFYCVDWDRIGRRQTVQIVDQESERVLDSREVNNFQDGVYLSYQVRGSVTFKIKATVGNPVVSAVFFGDQVLSPISTPLRVDLQRGNQEGTAGLVLQIRGPGGQRYVLEKSSDFKLWQPWRDLSLGDFTESIPLAPEDQHCWFRCRLAE